MQTFKGNVSHKLTKLANNSIFENGPCYLMSKNYNDKIKIILQIPSFSKILVFLMRRKQNFQFNLKIRLTVGDIKRK